MTYDVHGNTLHDGMRSYTWDARNRMTGVTKGGDTWTFAYNGANLRTSESRNGQVQRTCVWHGTEVVEERLADGSKRRYWSYGVEEVNAAGTQSGKRFLMMDHLGSTRVVLDAAGATVASYDYDPWGVRRKIGGSGEEAVGYTGHWEHESGLVMAPYRVYDPGLGRWLSEDPIFEAGGVNLYGYVGNGPVGSWDPLGFQSINSPAGAAVAAEVAATEAGYLNAAAMRAALALNAAKATCKAKRLADKVKRVSNPKHHKNSKSPEPSNVDELYDNAVMDSKGVSWARDSKGVIHRFSKPSNGECHWNGSTAGADPIKQNVIPNDVLKLLNMR